MAIMFLYVEDVPLFGDGGRNLSLVLLNLLLTFNGSDEYFF